MAEVAVDPACVCVRADELAELYDALAWRVRRIVGCHVTACDALIEDACQFAWGRLVRRPESVRRETALGWLARTAIREAFKLLRSETRAESLEGLLERETPEDQPGYGIAAPPEDPLGPVGLSVEEQVEQRDRLASLTRLPERQQRVLWLQGLGFSYVEMAVATGDSQRTVERQLMRAKRTLRADG